MAKAITFSLAKLHPQRTFGSMLLKKITLLIKSIFSGKSCWRVMLKHFTLVILLCHATAPWHCWSQESSYNSSSQLSLLTACAQTTVSPDASGSLAAYMWSMSRRPPGTYPEPAPPWPQRQLPHSSVSLPRDLTSLPSGLTMLQSGRNRKTAEECSSHSCFEAILFTRAIKTTGNNRLKNKNAKYWCGQKLIPSFFLSWYQYYLLLAIFLRLDQLLLLKLLCISSLQWKGAPKRTRSAASKHNATSL